MNLTTIEATETSMDSVYGEGKTHLWMLVTAKMTSTYVGSDADDVNNDVDDVMGKWTEG